MLILVGCEESQAVTIAFRALGHEAYSCDLQDCSGGHPEWHLKRDVQEVLKEPWDMIIAHPPCTYLTVSNNNAMTHGCKKYTAEEGQQLRKEGIDFFMLFVNHSCKKKAIENPIGIMSSRYRKPDQIIHPWEFGHGETKATCLWLFGLPKLRPTNIVEGREQKVWKMSPGPERDKLRSKTYKGIAEAMAQQWSNQ